MEAGVMERIFEEVKSFLDERDAARESMLSKGREIIRLSGSAISKMVTGDMDEAERILEDMRKTATEMVKSLQNYPELLNSPPSWSALAEYTEAEALYRVLKDGAVPPPEDLGISPVPYVLGLADLIGELRRVALEEVKRGELERAWLHLRKMEELYSLLSPLDYPDALIPGLRHKVDVARRLIDDTKYFLIDMESRLKLEKALKDAVRGAAGRSFAEH
ncbi:MAG: haloacid dehalogenase [Fervidicoccaceae archaeon]